MMQDQGYDCVGVFMKNWDSSDEFARENCPIDRDREHMMAVCNRLGIPGVEVEFIREYWSEVFVPFVDSYKSGVETPNPGWMRLLLFFSFLFVSSS